MQWRDFDRDRFLALHWQRQPLLIRNAFSIWQNLLEPDELAGLACEAEAESRLIIAHAEDRWSLEHGPFPEDRFSRLPASHWTLLVQAVDQWVPEVADLLAPFRFLPNWRIDDVMVSYAVDGGGVGPHVDHYDVFLVQGAGQRRWQVGPRCGPDAALREGLPLRQLAHFKPHSEWLLEPGDILYLPPGFAHNGIAVGDCMTYSVGFRAPSRSELIAHWTDHALAALTDDDRYQDPSLRADRAPGAIEPAELDRAHRLVLETLGDRERFATWFGGYVTARKYADLEREPAAAIQPKAFARQIRQAGIRWASDSRFAYRDQGDGGLMLFVDGEARDWPGALATLARQLADQPRLTPDEIAPWLERAEAMTLLWDLHRQGALHIGAD